MEEKNPTSTITKESFPILWQSISINVTDTYNTPPEMLSISGSTIGTLGNFSASTGKAKSKKTFNLSAIVAAALSGKEVLRYKAKLPTGKKHILYVDTEQSSYHCHKVLERILRLAGLPEHQNCPMLDFIMLREYSPNIRKQIIDLALSMKDNLGLVIIDGIRDLMYDINSPTESVELINLLMKWSAHYNLHIHTVLHLNKGDENTRGHIGTELNNKAETVLKIVKAIDDPSISEVHAMHIRDREFEPFAFRIDANALPVLIDNYNSSAAARAKQMNFRRLSEEQHKSALEFGFGDNAPIGYSDMIDALKIGYSSIGYDRGRSTIIGLAKWLVTVNAIIKKDNKYIYNPECEIPSQADE